MQVLQETGLWDLTFYHHVCLGLFTTISYETSFQSWCKTWNRWPGLIYGPSITVLHRISSCNSGIFEERPSGKWIGWGKPTAWPTPYPELNPLDYYLWRHLESILYATEVSDVQDYQQRNGVDLRWFVRDVEFSSESRGHCSDMQHLRSSSRQILWAFPLIFRGS
jgi:hypothetical protein